MSHKLYMSMRNMLSLAIPGHDWTDDAGMAALEEAHAACLDYEDRLANSRDWPNPSPALMELFRLRELVSAGKWEANLADGMLTIPGHNTQEFDEGYDALFCATAKNALLDFFTYLGDVLCKLDALRSTNMSYVNELARKDQIIAAQEYVIKKLDDIIYAVQNPHGLRLISEMHARQQAEARVRELEDIIRGMQEGTNA